MSVAGLASGGIGARWWGWGDAPDGHVDGRLDEILNLLGAPPRPPPAAGADQLAPPASRLLETARGALLRHAEVDVSALGRSLACFGSAYPDLVRRRRGEASPAPDAIVRPHTADGVIGTLRACADYDLAVVPRGAGTSLVGGADASGIGQRSGLVVIDTTGLRRVLDVDPISRRATVEAGVPGPVLEAAVREHGLSLGHAPGSFERSTVGGWVATGSASADAGGDGSIRQLVTGLRLASPVGMLELHDAPLGGEGPDLTGLVIGSEGTLGVICEVTLRLRRRPGAQAGCGLLFRSFADGLVALRRLAQDGLVPLAARLCDEDETRLWMHAAGAEDAARGARTRLAGRGAPGALLLLADAGSAGTPGRRIEAAVAACAAEAPIELGDEPARRWVALPARDAWLRDALIDAGVLVDTVETAGSWKVLPALREAVVAALVGALGNPALVTSRVAHATPDGASLAVTCFAPAAEGAELERWRAARSAALAAILGQGGQIAHANGIGSHSARWLARARGRTAAGLLRALKSELDPVGMMNPGKLVAEGA